MVDNLEEQQSTGNTGEHNIRFADDEVCLADILNNYKHFITKDTLHCAVSVWDVCNTNLRTSFLCLFAMRYMIRIFLHSF